MTCRCREGVRGCGEAGLPAMGPLAPGPHHGCPWLPLAHFLQVAVGPAMLTWALCLQVAVALTSADTHPGESPSASGSLESPLSPGLETRPSPSHLCLSAGTGKSL